MLQFSQQKGVIAVKKLLCACFVVLVCVSCAFAGAVITPSVGFLSRLNTSEEEFGRVIQDSRRTTGWNLLSNRHELYGVKFFDSLMAMQMALQRMDIDEIALPEIVAEYVINANPEFEACCIAMTRNPMALSFGVRKDDKALASRLNRALRMIDEDWTLAKIQGIYIYNYGTARPVKFDKFEGADTIKVAVTGDLPPIDYVDEGGRPAGFNTALLAEIGRRMRVNVELVNVEANARTAALTSGRVDIVFWYETVKGVMWNYDASEGVLLSDPYFSWNKFLHLKKK